MTARKGESVARDVDRRQRERQKRERELRNGSGRPTAEYEAKRARARQDRQNKERTKNTPGEIRRRSSAYSVRVRSHYKRPARRR